jgi:molybdopterin-guanine dinucleotide biosynthesis protein
MSAVFWPAAPSHDGRGGGDSRYEEFAPHFAECDLVIVEGDTQTRGPKVEVWRAVAGLPPMAANDPTIIAVVTDDPIQTTAERWPRCDVQAVARNILRLLGIAAL